MDKSERLIKVYKGCTVREGIIGDTHSPEAVVNGWKRTSVYARCNWGVDMEVKNSALSFSIENILYGRPSKSKGTEGIRRSWKYCNQSYGIMDSQPCSFRGCYHDCICVAENYSDRLQSSKHRNSLEDHEGKVHL